MLIQGFYNVGANSMTADTATVYIRNSNSPYAVVDTAIAFVNSTGQGTYTFSNASNGTPYYIQIVHRNSIETWCKNPQQFTASALTYNFTNANAQAYGDNMIQVDASPVKFAIYGGDVNRDGTVDATDVALIDNDAQGFVSGYVVTDLTGDDFVDGTDFLIADNNAANFVSAITP